MEGSLHTHMEALSPQGTPKHFGSLLTTPAAIRPSLRAPHPKPTSTLPLLSQSPSSPPLSPRTLSPQFPPQTLSNTPPVSTRWDQVWVGSDQRPGAGPAVGSPGSGGGEGMPAQPGAGEASQGHEFGDQPRGPGRGVWLPGPGNTCKGRDTEDWGAEQCSVPRVGGGTGRHGGGLRIAGLDSSLSGRTELVRLAPRDWSRETGTQPCPGGGGQGLEPEDG